MVNQEWFEDLWKKYPRPIGKKLAEKYFKVSVKTMQDLIEIRMALFNYLAKIKKDGTEEQYIPYGKTWFNNWRDWVDYKEFSHKPVQMPIVKQQPAPEPEITEEDRQETIAMLQSLKSKLKAKAVSR